MNTGVAMGSLFPILYYVLLGGYIGGGLYHSQNIEGALATLPKFGLFALLLPMMR